MLGLNVPLVAFLGLLFKRLWVGRVKCDSETSINAYTGIAYHPAAECA
jgi:hypothetical protein